MFLNRGVSSLTVLAQWAKRIQGFCSDVATVKDPKDRKLSLTSVASEKKPTSRFAKKGDNLRTFGILDLLKSDNDWLDKRLASAAKNVGFFSVATDVKLRFLSFGSFTVATSLQNL